MTSATLTTRTSTLPAWRIAIEFLGTSSLPHNLDQLIAVISGWAVRFKASEGIVRSDVYLARVQPYDTLGQTSRARSEADHVDVFADREQAGGTGFEVRIDAVELGAIDGDQRHGMRLLGLPIVVDLVHRCMARQLRAVRVVLGQQIEYRFQSLIVSLHPALVAADFRAVVHDGIVERGLVA